MMRSTPTFFRTVAAIAALAAPVVASACTATVDAPAPNATSASAAPVLADPAAEGARLADGFFAAIKSGDPARVSEVMAPEARVARANGDVVVRDDYLTKLPIIESYSIDKVGANQSGDVMVVTYHVEVEEVIDGVEQPTKEAPRLTVFQWQGGVWKLIAHANFGGINSAPAR